MKQKHAPCETPWNLRKQQTKPKSAPRTPPFLQCGKKATTAEVRERRDTLCKGRRVRSAARGTASPGAVTGKPQALPQPPRVTKRRVFTHPVPAPAPARGASGEESPAPCQTSGGADTRDPQRRAAPAPILGPRWALCCCRRTDRGPQNTPPPPSRAGLPSLKGQRSGRGTLGAGCPGVPAARARNVGPPP